MVYLSRATVVRCRDRTNVTKLMALRCMPYIYCHMWHWWVSRLFCAGILKYLLQKLLTSFFYLFLQSTIMGHYISLAAFIFITVCTKRSSARFNLFNFLIVAENWELLVYKLYNESIKQHKSSVFCKSCVWHIDLILESWVPPGEWNYDCINRSHSYFCHAMPNASAAYAIMRCSVCLHVCMSVRPSVTFVHAVSFAN